MLGVQGRERLNNKKNKNEQVGISSGSEFHLFTAMPAHGGRGVRARGVLPVGLTMELLSDTITSVQAAVSPTVQVRMDQLTEGFPPSPFLNAMSIVYSLDWEDKPVVSSLSGCSRLQTTIARSVWRLSTAWCRRCLMVQCLMERHNPLSAS